MADTPTLDPAAPVVALRGVGKQYADGESAVHALREVTLDIARGDFVALVGPSGSGKTTLMNLIGALDRPSTGEVSVGGDSLGRADARQLAVLRLRRIGFVFQDHNLMPVLTALENVELVLLLQGVPAAERRRRATEALALLGLAAHLHRRPGALSGGQQQRVAIARALAGDPLLILADEPTANLDSDTGQALLAAMLELNRQRGTTFVLATHDPMVIGRAARIVRLKDGRIQADAPADPTDARPEGRTGSRPQGHTEGRG